VPALASLGIFQCMWVWNDLLVSLIFLGGNSDHAPMTLPVANLVGQYGENYPVLTAAAFAYALNFTARYPDKARKAAGLQRAA